MTRSPTKPRGQVSIRADVYERLLAVCRERNVSVSATVEQMFAGELLLPGERLPVRRSQQRYEIPVSPAIRSLFHDQAVRNWAEGGRATPDEMAERAVLRMLDALESGAARLQESGTCVLCQRDGVLIAGECERCRSEHPRARGYDFASARSTGLGVRIGRVKPTGAL